MTRPISVIRRMVDAVDHEHVHRRLCRLELQPELLLQRCEQLRSLQFGSRRRSIFGPDGIVAGTERAERLLFWPMGIASAGAMRQWGRQATAFVGRRHFDDADLVERRFELDLGGAG